MKIEKVWIWTAKDTPNAVMLKPQRIELDGVTDAKPGLVFDSVDARNSALVLLQGPIPRSGIGRWLRNLSGRL